MDFNLAALAKNAKKRAGEYRLDPIHTRTGSEVAYRKILAEMLRGLLNEVNTAILPTYTADTDEPWYARLAALGSTLAATASAKMTKLFYSEAGWHTRQFAATVLRGLGVDVSGLLSQLDTEELMRLYIAQNTDLITNLKDDAIKIIRQEIMSARIQKQQPEQLAETLRHKLNILRTSRAELIATDQLGKLTASLNKHRQQQSGMTEYRWNYRSWIKREDPREDHQAVNGKYYRWGESTGTNDGKEPGTQIRCLPGDAVIHTLGGVSKFTRRFYTGKLTEIITDSGKIIKSTPNHPHFAANGWKAADSFKVGDYIAEICGHGGFVSNAYDHNFIPTIEQAFKLFLMMGVAESYKVFRSDFHGDGVENENVDIINVDCFLSYAIQSIGLDGICEKRFASAMSNTLGSFFGFCSLHNSGGGLGLSSGGYVGIFRELLSVFGGETAHSDNRRIPATAWLDSILFKSIVDCLPANSHLLGKGLSAYSLAVERNNFFYINVMIIMWFALMNNDVEIKTDKPPSHCGFVSIDGIASLDKQHAGLIEFVRVKDVRVTDFSGHVYNLETDDGYYVANGIITHNCKCWAQAVVRIDDDE